MMYDITMKSYVITSGKGGVGKTTVTAYLGRALAEQGLRVVVLDTDFGLNNLDVVMNLENRVVYDMCDVIANKCRAKQALIADTTRGLYLLPASNAYNGSQISGQNIRVLLKALSASFDIALVDCPAGIEVGFHRAVSACDSAIVVTTPHISALRDADKVVRLLDSYALPRDIIINRLRPKLVKSGIMPSPTEIAELLKCRTVGVIEESDKINGTDKFFSAAFTALAKNLIYGSTQFKPRQEGGIFRRVRSKN